MIAFGVEDPVIAAAVAYRGAFRNRGGGDTGQSANAFQEILLEARALLEGQVEGTGVHIGDEHAILLEARIARHQVLEAARKEQSAREQDDRKGNLRGDQDALQAETFAASGHAAPTGLQDGSRRDIPRAQSGGKAKEQGRQESQGGGKTEDAPVRGHIEKNGVIRRADEGDERPAECGREKTAAHSAGDGQQRAFREQLASETERAKLP